MSTKKRCIIQKLDFENCIVTNIRTKSRTRKKLRARITREFEQIDDIKDEGQSGEGSLNILSSPITREATSPVLVKKHIAGDESPVFFKKQKLGKKEDDCENSPETDFIDSSPPASPVFKLKVVKNSLLNKSQEQRKTLRRMSNYDLFSQESSSSCGASSYQIEDFTQETKPSIKISSVESTEIKSKSSGDYSVDCQSDSSKHLNISWNRNEPDPLTKWLDTKELNDSLKNIRKNYKKNSLLGRLQKLLQKQASEKLLWQHQNRKNSTSTLKFVVVSFWSEEFKFILKCRSLDSASEIAFVVVDRKWVPNVKKIQEGSVIHLHPPWQKLSIQKSMLTVFLNIICLDVLDEVEETALKNTRLESLPTNEFERDPSLFINSLFSFRFSEVLI